MKIIEDIIIPAYKSTKIKYFCDICKINLEERKSRSDSSYAQLFYLNGNLYPECDTREGKRIDICTKCAEEKVIPLIEKEFNIKAREIEQN